MVDLGALIAMLFTTMYVKTCSWCQLVFMDHFLHSIPFMILSAAKSCTWILDSTVMFVLSIAFPLLIRNPPTIGRRCTICGIDSSSPC